MSDEQGIDLSEPTETSCFLCGVQVPNESYSLHVSWHSGVDVKDSTYMNPHNGTAVASPGYYPQLSFYAGMPMDQVIRHLADAIEVIQRTIGSEGAYRFLRDYTQA